MAREEARSDNGVMDRLKAEARSLAGALGDRAVTSVRDKVEGATGRLTDYAEGGGGPGMMAALTGAKSLAEGKSPIRAMAGAGMAGLKEKVMGLFGGKGKGGGQKLKVTNIVESIDVGVPVRVAYNQWTQFSDFPRFMKKVENVDQDKKEENKTTWKAQVFWSHRSWQATVVEQVPDERIVWRSKGEKGRVDGAVTFHELAPSLTRILVILEYHPQGLFERTGNMWRAQGRRARLELKNFRRHIMTEGVLHGDEIEGWRGTIHDGEVTESHEDAVAREEEDGSRSGESRQSRGGRSSAGGRRSGSSGQSGTGRQAGNGRRSGDGQVEDASGDENDEHEETGSRATRNGRTARAGGSGTRRSAGTRSRRTAGTGSERRQRSGSAAQRGGSR